MVSATSDRAVVRAKVSGVEKTDRCAQRWAWSYRDPEGPFLWRRDTGSRIGAVPEEATSALIKQTPPTDYRNAVLLASNSPAYGGRLWIYDVRVVMALRCGREHVEVAFRRMGKSDSGAALVIADVSMALDDAVDALMSYPRRTPWAYDLTAEERQGVEPAEMLRRTRRVRSRLSERALEAMVRRTKDAPWEGRLGSADLADLHPGGDLWAAADALYLHFLDPRIERVGFAKVHKYLHLVYPSIFPVLDSRVRRMYRSRQRALAAESGLAGGGHWRRRTWLAIGADLSTNRESGAIRQLRNRLDSCASVDDGQAERVHARRILTLGDLRLLDMLTWKAFVQAK